ncbi:MAG: adenylate/guanylate cyclase domain-containing protein [Spirosomataceae bacterium]
MFILTKGQISSFGQSNPNRIQSQKYLADSIFKVAKKYENLDNQKLALESYQSSLKIYKNIGDNIKIGDCMTNIGVLYYFQGDIYKSLQYFKESLAVFKKAGDKSGIASSLNNLGGLYHNIGKYPEAVEYLKQAAEANEKIQVKKEDKEFSATIIENIGIIYAKVKDYDNAMKYYEKANLMYKEINAQKGMAKILLEKGILYKEQGSPDKALDNFNKALELIKETNHTYVEVEILANLGELFFSQSDFDKSLYYYNFCLKEAERIGNIQYRSESRVSIGKIFIEFKEYEKAIDKCKSGLKQAEKIGFFSLKKNACECLYKSYKSLNKDKLALYYFERAHAYEDSMQSEEALNKIMNMEFQKQQLVDSIAYVKKENLLQLKHKAEVQKKEKQRNIIIVSLGFIFLIAVGLWGRLNLVRKSKAALQIEKDRSEALLLNILPEEIAEELKEKGSVNAREFNLVSILFSDFKSFTQTAEKMTPQTLVEEINVCFKAFDLIAEKYQVEKIKTIGDAYMAAGGIPVPSEDSLKNIVLAGLEMQAFMIERAKENEKSNLPFFEMRLGIHAGPIVAGIVGVKKFQYDVWGDTVNTASRIESNGMVGKVNISETLYQLIKHEPCFKFEYRGNINAKGKGEIAMYFVEKKENS